MRQPMLDEAIQDEVARPAKPTEAFQDKAANAEPGHSAAIESHLQIKQYKTHLWLT